MRGWSTALQPWFAYARFGCWLAGSLQIMLIAAPDGLAPHHGPVRSMCSMYIRCTLCEDFRQRAAAQRSEVDVVSAVLTYWLWQLVGMESMAALADQCAVHAAQRQSWAVLLQVLLLSELLLLVPWQLCMDMCVGPSGAQLGCVTVWKFASMLQLVCSRPVWDPRPLCRHRHRAEAQCHAAPASQHITSDESCHICC
jgi:hypothetical protein